MKPFRFLASSAVTIAGLLAFSGCSGVVTSTQSPSEACEVVYEGVGNLDSEIAGLDSDPSGRDEVIRGIDAITADVTNEEISPAWRELAESLKEFVSLGSQMVEYSVMEETPDLSEEEIESLQNEFTAAQDRQYAAVDEINRLCTPAE